MSITSPVIFRYGELFFYSLIQQMTITSPVIFRYGELFFYSLIQQMTITSPVIFRHRKCFFNQVFWPTTEDYCNKTRLMPIKAIPATRPYMDKWCSPYFFAVGRSWSSEMKIIIPATAAKIIPKARSLKIEERIR
jgi:hypothetical protein